MRELNQILYSQTFLILIEDLIYLDPNSLYELDQTFSDRSLGAQELNKALLQRLPKNDLYLGYRDNKDPLLNLDFFKKGVLSLELFVVIHSYSIRCDTRTLLLRKKKTYRFQE